MDASTITFHRALLRLLKGCAKAYEKWIADQAAPLVVESLRERKADLSRETPIETTRKSR